MSHVFCPGLLAWVRGSAQLGGKPGLSWDQRQREAEPCSQKTGPSLPSSLRVSMVFLSSLPHCVSIHALTTSSCGERLPSSGLTSYNFSLTTFSSVRIWVFFCFLVFFLRIFIYGLCFSSRPSILALLPFAFWAPLS